MYLLEKGNYIVRIGNSSDSLTASAVLHLAETKDVKKTAKIVSESVPFEVLRSRPKNEMCPDLAVIEIDAGGIETEICSYPPVNAVPERRTAEILGKMNFRQMIDIVTGEGVKGMFAGTGIVTPGAAGRTTSGYFAKGLLNVNLCDGPAGLRIMNSAVIKGGWVKMGTPVMKFMEYFPLFIKKLIMTSPKEEGTGYQYATAFPAATSLAQTWNVQLCEDTGKAISEEMSCYHVTYWLGPAMNIQRNPLCGRNFEYYSEDPLLTGKIAAALIRGVQSIPGNYACIKHFACNNTEEYRMTSDSILDERTLREIYLKGFEIAVKEAHPAACMTSYNLINGKYAAERYEIITDVLRNEWGFDGIVMTDWNSTGKGRADNAAAMKAGNDLIMPGGIYYRKELLKSLNQRKLESEVLRNAAVRVVNQIVLSRIAAYYDPDEFR